MYKIMTGCRRGLKVTRQRNVTSTSVKPWVRILSAGAHARTHAHTHEEMALFVWGASECSTPSGPLATRAFSAVCGKLWPGQSSDFQRHGIRYGRWSAHFRRLPRLFRGHLRRLAAPKARQERSSSTRVTQCPPPCDRSVDSDDPWKNGNLGMSASKITAVITRIWRNHGYIASHRGPYDRTRNMEHIIVPRASWTRIAMIPSCLGRTISRRLRARPFFLTFYRWKSLRLLRGLLRGGRPPRFCSSHLSPLSLSSGAPAVR